MKHKRLCHPDWEPGVKNALNELLDSCGRDAPEYDGNSYAVFDFDNTCAIFDVEEQRTVWQILTMRFALDPQEMGEMLRTGLEGRYAELIDDITAAYAVLWESYGPFTAAGLAPEDAQRVHANLWWREFSAKLKALMIFVMDRESPYVAFPWILYWLSGMTEQECRELSYDCQRFFMTQETVEEHWRSPAEIPSRYGVVCADFPSGVSVTENIRELMEALQDNGIDVWICSASGTDTICGAVDALGLHGVCRGVIAMCHQMDEQGRYRSAYDYEHGFYWETDGVGWVRKSAELWEQIHGPGKREAILRVIAPRYGGKGPVAGFMDSTGDFEFCTEFSDMRAALCFNRGDRGVTEGGGLIAVTAVYQSDVLHYDLAAAGRAGDTLYLLQGRDENGGRRFLPSRSSLLLSGEEKLFAGAENEKLLAWMAGKQMSTREALEHFSRCTSAENSELGFAYGFTDDYPGYHSY